jgi:ABC-type glutathione transport system ATPase component
MMADLNSSAKPEAKAAAESYAIQVDHIVKKYGDFTAVNDVSFNVNNGEIFGLLGPNGAGKSTLIRMMTTLIPITNGVARIAGHDVAKDPDAVRRTIGVIPQALTSDLDLTVEENLNIYAKLYDVPAKERKRSIDELLGLVDLTKWRDAASAGDRSRPGSSSQDIFSRRTHHRPRSRIARRSVGDARQHQKPAPTHHSHYHSLHGRSRPALRSHRNCRSRQTGRARRAHGAEGERPGFKCD